MKSKSTQYSDTLFTKRIGEKPTLRNSFVRSERKECLVRDLARVFLLVFQILILGSGLSASTTLQVSQPIITISGTVTDAQDSGPLPAVTIMDGNKKRLSSTANNGSFSVRVPKGTAITFVMIGYTS